jgi:hypothetical protein
MRGRLTVATDCGPLLLSSARGKCFVEVAAHRSRQRPQEQSSPPRTTRQEGQRPAGSTRRRGQAAARLVLPLPPALCCSCGGSSAPRPLAPPDGGVGIAPHLRCCARMRLTRLCAAVTLRLIAAGVATPTYDPAHPDQSPAPHSNAEFSSGTSATTPTGAGGVPLPWLKGLLTAEGQRLMWDGQTVHNSPGQSCRWGTYLCYNAPPVDGHGCTGQPVGSKAHNYPGAGAYAAGAPATGTEMCLHGYDMISNSISDWGGGQWQDCPQLRKLWLKQFGVPITGRSSGTVDGPDTQPWPTAKQGAVYLEVGTNIGSCLVDMLMHTDARIIAFEPAPANLFCLTSTLLKLPEEYRARVALFPIGAGDANIESVIYAKSDNHGHSVVRQRLRCT